MTEPVEKSSEKTSEEKTKVTPDVEVVESAVRKMVANKPEKLLEFMAMEMSSGGNPLHQKMTPEHISQVLDLAANHDERQYNLHKTSQSNDFEDGKSNRRYAFSAFMIVVILTTIVLFLFQEKPQLLIPILTGLGGLISGFLGGWGYGKKNR